MNLQKTESAAYDRRVTVPIAHPATLRPRWHNAYRAGTFVCSAFLLGCVATFLWATRHWPVVNDPALMHYVVVLMRDGMAPYRDIHDINLPGSYALEWLSMAAAGLLHLSENAIWRATDIAVLALGFTAMVRIAGRYSWFAGVVAGSLFALYHGRDGVGHAGQRDLVVAVLALWAIDLLLRAMRWPGSATPASQGVLLGGFGLCVGVGATIKPTALGFLLCLLPLLIWQRTTIARLRVMSQASAGVAVPLLAAWLFLLHWHATAAFAHMLRFDLPYHSSLARGTIPQLLAASSISSIRKMLVLLAVTALLAGGWRGSASALRTAPRLWAIPHAWIAGSDRWARAPERCLLLFCALLGFLSFFVQGKGYPYQRYPFVAFLLLLASLEFTAAAQSTRRWLRAAGVAGLAFAVLLCAPVYLRGAVQARWSTPVMRAMESSIAAQAGPAGLSSLDGRVQCLDIATGCTDALLHLHLREATGTIYDEFLFPQRAMGWAFLRAAKSRTPAVPSAAVLDGRRTFQQALTARPPRVILISSWLFPEGPGYYQKLSLWPWFQAYLTRNYVQVEEHRYAQEENGPLGYRVYVQRSPS